MTGGQITTCYSFKGGSGRSMSLANVAWALAARGLRVLVIDWDLEAPGLHRYFHPFLEDPLQQVSEGLVDALWNYVSAVPDGAAKRTTEYAELADYVQPLTLPFSRGGSIDFLGAGRQDAQYTERVGRFDWMTFYARLNGRQFIDAVGRWARANYDQILIDSRTGVSDTAGICTVQLPDTLALFFVYNRQSIEGTAAAARAVRIQRRKSPLRILACPSRVEDRKLAGPGRQYAAFSFEDVLDERWQTLARKLRAHEILRFAWCAYEEKLAVFEEEAEESGTLLQTMEALATRISGVEPGETEYVKRDILSALWRRAAFRDPRLDEMEAVRTGSLTQRVSQLKVWLGETLQDPDKGSEWPTILARECAAVAVAGFGSAPSEDLEQLGEGAIDLARRLRSRKDADIAVVIDVFRSRAVQLRREGRLAEAYEIASEAIEMSAADENPALRSVMLRALELRAEIARLIGMPDSALQDLRRLVAEYEGSGVKRDPRRPFGRARAHRLLAEALFEGGIGDEALEEANAAVKIASASADESGYSAEAALARLIQARVALASHRPEAEKIVKRMETWLNRAALPESTTTETLVRLRIATADYYRETERHDRALEVLNELPPKLPTWASAEVAEAKVRISEEKSGHIDSSAIDGLPTSPSQLVDFLNKAIDEAGDNPAAREQLIRNLVERTVLLSAESDDTLAGLFSAMDPELRAAVMKALRGILSQASSESIRLAS